MTVYQQIQRNKWRTAILMSLFIAFVLFLGYIIGESQAGGGGYAGVLIAALISGGMALSSYFGGDTVALATAGAQKIEKADNPYLWNMVENLAITAGLPMPDVYIINDPALNAFATGRNPEKASVAFTTGIINALENEELEGVVAHELSHIQNYDTRLMMVVVVLVGVVALIADWFWRIRLFGSGDSRGRMEGRAQLILFVAGIVLIGLSPIIAQLIKLSVSRKREYLADASAVLMTRYADGLASALAKIGGQEQSGANELERANHATAHLFLASPFKPNGFMNRLFSTHPPIEKRIEALRSIGSGR